MQCVNSRSGSQFLNIFVGGRCVSVSFPACTFGKSDASFMIKPARSGNRSTVVQRHPLARALSVLGTFIDTKKAFPSGRRD